MLGRKFLSLRLHLFLEKNLTNFSLLKQIKYYTANPFIQKSLSFPCLTASISFALGIGLGVFYNKPDFEKVNLNIFDKVKNHIIWQFLEPLHAKDSLDENGIEIKKTSPRKTFNFIADVAENIAPSVVGIEIRTRHPLTGEAFSITSGSGFIVKSDGLILTNAHVVSHPGSAIVKLHDGREFAGVVENQDTITDLATVRINAKDLKPLPLGKSSELRPGEFVLAMGNPLTLSHTITCGVVSSKVRHGKEIGWRLKSDYIQTDAAVNIGNSGGPLVNLDGEVIGINTIKVTEGISFAIPSDEAQEFLNKTEKNKAQKTKFWKPKKSVNFFGISMVTLTPSLIRELKNHHPDFPNVKKGVLVWKVILGSPAYQSAFKPGDIITKINGNEVESASDIYKFLESESIINVHYIRKNHEYDVTVKLSENEM